MRISNSIPYRCEGGKMMIIQGSRKRMQNTSTVADTKIHIGDASEKKEKRTKTSSEHSTA